MLRYAICETQTRRDAAKHIQTQRIQRQPTRNMGRSRMQANYAHTDMIATDQNSADEEEEIKEKEDARKSRSVAKLRQMSEDGSKMEKDSAKSSSTPKNMLPKSNHGKEAVSKSLQSVPRKMLPNQNSKDAKDKTAQTRLLSAKGKDAQNRLSSDKNKFAKTKSNDVLVSNEARALASTSTSKVLQSANQGIGNLKKPPEPIFAPSPVIAPGSKQAAANLQRVPKTTNKIAQKHKQSVAAATESKSLITKRKAREDQTIPQRKKARSDDMFAKAYETTYNKDNLESESKKGMFKKVYDNIYNKDNLESEDEANELLTSDRLIAKAEKICQRTAADLGENSPLEEKDTKALLKVVRYSAKIAKACNTLDGSSSESPIWSTETPALERLHGLQAMNIMVCDILASLAQYEESDDSAIMQMLSIYISKFGNIHCLYNCKKVSLAFLDCASAYQIDQNNRTDVDFNQDLEVMEKLIEKYVSNGSICKVFAEAFPIDNHPLLGGWEELENDDNSKKRGRKDDDNLDDKDGADGKHGARLLLLLAYMMVSNVLDDMSNDTLM